MWGCPLDASFHLIMELCSDISILGLNLLETANKLMGYSQGEKRDGNIYTGFHNFWTNRFFFFFTV